jgi:hypothetical protein
MSQSSEAGSDELPGSALCTAMVPHHTAGSAEISRDNGLVPHTFGLLPIMTWEMSSASLAIAAPTSLPVGPSPA